MKNFKNVKLYDSEIGAFTRFVDEILETKSEFDSEGRNRNYKKEEEFEDTGINLMDSFDMEFNSAYSNPSMPDSFDNMGGGYKSIKPVLSREFDSYDEFRQFMLSPFEVFRVMHNIVISPQNYGVGKESYKHFLSLWRYVGVGLFGVSLLNTVGVFVFPLNLLFGVSAFVSSVLADIVGEESFTKPYMYRLFGRSVEESEEESQVGDGGEDVPLNGLDDYPYDGGDEFSFGFGDGGFDWGESSAPTSLADQYGEDDELEDVSEVVDPEEETSKILEIFPESTVVTSRVDGEAFRKSLVKTFNSKQSKGEMLHLRSDILREFAAFMPGNDKGFASWFHPLERKIEYLNVAYTIYKALVEINEAFSLSRVEGQKLTVLELKRTPLMYRVTVKLPSFIKIESVLKRHKTFVDMAKASDKDNEVGVILSSFGGNLVIKLLKFDYKGIVSMGDIIRMDAKEEGEETVAERLLNFGGLPLLMGLRSNEYPYLVDLEDNPATSVVGGTGSGKSWLTFQILMSLAITLSPEEIQFLVMDAKNAAIWKQLALSPHVLGYHSDINQFSELLDEVEAEHLRRMAFLSEQGVESWKVLRKQYKKQGRHHELWKIPMLVVVIDEITFTMTSLADKDTDLYKKVKGQLSSLSSVVRASGIRLVLIGQRAIDTSIPKTYLANSPLKLAMKMNALSDFKIMLGDKYDKDAPRIPSGAGEGLMLAEGQNEIAYVKTAIPAGFDDVDVLMHLRTISLDWARRTIGGELDYLKLFPNGMDRTLTKSFNRSEFYVEALNALREGRITRPKEVDREYAGLEGVIPVTSAYMTNTPLAESHGEESLIPQSSKTQKTIEEHESILAGIDWDEIDEYVKILEDQDTPEKESPESLDSSQSYSLEESLDSSQSSSLEESDGVSLDDLFDDTESTPLADSDPVDEGVFQLDFDEVGEWEEPSPNVKPMTPPISEFKQAVVSPLADTSGQSNLSVDAYIYTYGESFTSGGVIQYRMEKDKVQAIFNSKKIRLAVMTAQIRPDDTGNYYIANI